MIMGREPVTIAAAIRAILLAGMAFGLKLDAAQMAAVMFAAEAILALLVRGSVTPISDPRLDLNSTLNRGTAVVESVAPHA